MSQTQPAAVTKADILEMMKNNPLYICVLCPTCWGVVFVAKHELNCAVFRHGIMLATGEPIPPHATQIECEELIKQKAVLGCGQPFKIEAYQDEVPIASDDVAMDATVNLTRHRAVLCGWI